ncbi:MarR family winged helix-turn-helix transcriptional regulator [Intestinimonas butyriciproducens]|uniref:MarR family winged helix-turn-helix transcriptional regulator n=1 Tax=Intestinimonas butyriciproducens TaxID=1297617 RepID=UPI00232EEC9A|nr:MarR family transcriptional regulator [Intestinimonas butyriciproducens]MDB7861256.1 MarR family transcriptional regulator [Intestinimonas butyriciproducens]MDB7864108.1 MarR family transcriptional regulator [Intestinimonas butyriciproducens]
MEMRENMPGILFQSVERARKQAIQTELSRRGLGTLGQPMILFLLKDKGREGRIAAQKELSDAMHVSPATVAVSLKSLEREGYVEKLADETDQRRKAVQLTPKGEAAIQRCVQVFEAVDQSMFEGFRPEETRQACGYLMRMLHNLRGDLPPERMNCQC